MTHRVGLGIACLAVALAQAPEAEAQPRGHSYDGHRRSRPRRHLGRAPTPPAPAPTGPWTAARARFILSAESLFGAAHLRQTASATSDGDTAEVSASGFSVHFLKGSDIFDPFGQARLGVDGVVGPGVTLGGSIGYSKYEQTVGSVSNELSGFVIVPRLGYMLAPSRYVGVWLRAGVGYASLNVDNDGSGLSQHFVGLVLDPMLVVTPLPHVGVTLGPSLNIGLDGKVKAGGLEVDSTTSSYGLTAGLALLF